MNSKSRDTQTEFGKTKENHHRFKKGKSTTTAGLAIQAALARAIDQGKFAVVANLDLSCAFDLVNIKLLIKDLKPDLSTSVWE